MTRAWVALVLLTSVAAANSDRVAIDAIVQFRHRVVSSSNDMSDIEAKLKPVMKKMSAKLAVGVVRTLNRGFERKYKKGIEFYRGICSCLAAGGGRGISTLYRRYKAEGKRHDLRLEIVKALGACGDTRALSTIMKMVHDKTDEVAAAAIQGSASYNTVDEKTRKNVAKILVQTYVKTESKAAGKGRTTKERVRLDLLKEPLQNALTAYCNGEKFTNGAAWSSWLRENITQSWKK